jgi:hypothetical protein
MALKDVLGPVNTILTTNGALSLTPGTPALELASTPRRDRTATPRVTWVPTQDTFGPPTAPAMTKAAQAAYFAANGGKQIPRSLATRYVGLEAHIWAGTAVGAVDDYSAAEALLGAVVSALRHQAYGVVHLGASAWVNPRSTEGNTLGHRYVLNLSIEVPVLEVQDNATPQPGERTTLTTFTPQTDQMGPIPPGATTFTQTP